MAGAPVRARCALDRAYLATSYRVFIPGARPIDLRAGQRCARLDRLLVRARATDWAFISAANPASRPLPAWRNAYRQRRLLALLAAGPCLVLPGLGIPDARGWQPEESLLVAPRSRALRLARAFRQNAVLAGRRGRPARVVWLT